ncbi:MAG: hypothetical protein Q7T68_02505 [Sphingopyxis sp.]|nr:hypothetical protein [Sphingopyxis sp.]
MGKIDWADRMVRLPNEDLIEIVSAGDAGGYEPHVVEAAATEMGRRKLSTATVAELEASAQERQFARDSRATEPLTNGAWVAFIIFGPIMVVTLAIAIFFFSIGQRQKGKDALSAIFFSFLVWWAVAMIVLAVAWLAA